MSGLAVVLRARHHGETHVSTFDLDESRAGDLRCQVCGTYVGALVSRGDREPLVFGRQLVKMA